MLLVALGCTPAWSQTYTKEQIEAIKRQNEKAASNNALIQQANSAMAAKNWQAAVGPLQQLIANDPTKWQYYSGLGDAQLNLGQYDKAADAYQRGVQAAGSGSTDPAMKATIGRMLVSEGNAYLKLHKNEPAIAAFTRAASLDPNPATAFFNLCAIQYNTGNATKALDACEKAIAADPNKADAYFIRGSLLIGRGKKNPDGKIAAPPGAADALRKYLELAPNGAHAKDAREMLALLGR